MEPLKPGKLPQALLARLLSGLDCRDERVVLPPQIGTDATVIAFGERCLVAASDPITFATSRIGGYAVMVNANDVACLGADPRWFLATVLLPEAGTRAALVEEIFADMAERACAEVGAVLCGGHTEISVGLDRPIVSATMLGECAREDLVLPSGARAGDVVVATKGIAIEGTATLAIERAAELARDIPGPDLERMRALLDAPGIGVVHDSRVARAAGGVHAMHDVTEGGLATAAAELAAASGLGMEVDEGAVPILPETAALCRAVGAEPMGLLGSGCLVISAAREQAPAMRQALEGAGIPAYAIGRMVLPEHGVCLINERGERRPMPVFDRDEIARILG